MEPVLSLLGSVGSGTEFRPSGLHSKFYLLKALLMHALALTSLLWSARNWADCEAHWLGFTGWEALKRPTGSSHSGHSLNGLNFCDGVYRSPCLLPEKQVEGLTMVGQWGKGQSPGIGHWQRISTPTHELAPKLTEWLLGQEHGTSLQEGMEDTRGAYDSGVAM